MEIQASKYGTIFSDEEMGRDFLLEINQCLQNTNPVTLDFDKVLTMTTFNAKQIFGELYSSLGPEDFFKKIIFKNTSKNIVTIIKLGIQDKLMSEHN
jgi:hypothetical protein